MFGMDTASGGGAEELEEGQVSPVRRASGPLKRSSRLGVEARVRQRMSRGVFEQCRGGPGAARSSKGGEII